MLSNLSRFLLWLLPTNKPDCNLKYLSNEASLPDLSTCSPRFAPQQSCTSLGEAVAATMTAWFCYWFLAFDRNIFRRNGDVTWFNHHFNRDFTSSRDMSGFFMKIWRSQTSGFEQVHLPGMIHQLSHGLEPDKPCCQCCCAARFHSDTKKWPKDKSGTLKWCFSFSATCY